MAVVAMVTGLIPDLDSNDAPSFEDEVTSFQVLIGGTAELNVHLLMETKSDKSKPNRKGQFSFFSLSCSFIMLSTFPLLSMAEAV